MHVYVSAVLRECGACVRQCSVEGVYVSAALRECGTCVRQCSVEGVWYMCTAVQH